MGPSRWLQREIMMVVRGLEVVRLGLRRGDWQEVLVEDLRSLAFWVDQAVQMAVVECGKEVVESGNRTGD
jgi:hypothetical protein